MKISKIIRRGQRKVAEEERKGKQDENAMLHKSNAPDLINSKPIPSLSHSPLVPAPVEERENKRQVKQKDCVPGYYPPSPIYVASYDKDAPNQVNNLVPELTPKEKRNTNKKEESKTTADRRDQIEIQDEKDDLKSDWDSEYSC